VDSDRQVRLLGLGLLHGLLDVEAIRAVADDPDPIATLTQRGLLDPQEATALFQFLDQETQQISLPPRARPTPSAETEGPVRTRPGQEGRGPWDSLPTADPNTDGSGRQVLRVLTLSAWKQYLNLRFIAEGGMGRVFKAFDPSLKRSVALKFLRRDDPELVARFVLEAQHQAMVEHPHICRVYEVGEWQGQSYIAMQFVQGETLEAALPRLTLLEKVQVMEAVAEAIHAAHRVSLIHRDLKPSNIMVTRREQSLEPAILDFGLARGLDAAEFTQHGQAVGTVHYMAPEQVRGHHDRINRCTDVYGLGATLHKVLTGEAPFAAYDGIEAFRRTVETDLPSLRRLVPDLPADLDTIVRKCLEKDPARRYESALAVGEDLRRWREGEPILARQPTYAYLATKWARRHKLVVAVAGVGLLAVLALGGFAFMAASGARAQARHAQHFGQEAERIEALLRYAALLPPHDVRPELNQARARMAALEREAQRSGRLAAGPAAYALGRSHLALGDPDKARGLLERAWSGGLHTPEVALALGRALAANYQQELDLARALPSKDLREARERELARELRDPALARLREGASAALEAPAYQEALVAFMGGQFDGAQAKAREALAATPWLFEAKRLEGEVLLARAPAAKTPAEALDLLDQAEAAFTQALRLGPSDPATALAQVQVLVERAKVELTSGGRAEATLARCRVAVVQARILQPTDGQAQAHLARALSLWADTKSFLSPSTQEIYAEAERLSAEALAQSPSVPAVLGLRIRVLVVVATQRKNLGQDPLPAYQEAQDLARLACQRFPQDPLYTALLSAACMRRMTWEINAGRSPWATFEEGLAQALSLRTRFPDLSYGYQGLRNLWIERAEYERRHGLDPRPSVAVSLSVLQDTRTRGLYLQGSEWGRGDAHLILGDHLLTVEGGGEADYLQAAEAFGRALKENPNQLQALGSQASAHLGRAMVLLERGQDPSSALVAAEDSLAAMGNQTLNHQETDVIRGLAALLRGRHHLALGGDPGPDWARAAAIFRKASTLSQSAVAYAGEAEVAARAYLHRGRPQARRQAQAAAQQALKADAQGAEGWLWLAVVEQEALRRGDRTAEGPAREAWAKALGLNANLRRTALRLGMPGT
jgi:serine/threonine-protein kinase